MAKKRQRRSWSLEFYQDALKRLPVQQWLDGLREDIRGRLLANIQLLAEHGPTLDFPHTSQIEGKLRELRAQIDGQNYRVLYFFDERRVGILLHGFIKTTAAVPEADRRMAVARMTDHINRLHAKKRGK